MSKDTELDALVRAALGELLNLAAEVAELQVTEQGAEEIYSICDLVAEYYQIERAIAFTEDNEDGSYTTRFESYTGTSPTAPRTEPIQGSISTKGKPKLRLVDSTTPPNPKKDKE